MKEIFNVADVEVVDECGGWYVNGYRSPSVDGYSVVRAKRERGRTFYILLEDWNGERWAKAYRIRRQDDYKVGECIGEDICPIYDTEDEDADIFNIIGLKGVR